MRNVRVKNTLGKAAVLRYSLCKCRLYLVVLAICADALVQSMAAASTPPKLPRLQPSDDASPLLVLDDLPPLPPPALAAWDRLALIRFYNAHRELKQDLLKKRTRGVCTIRFREHCRRIPQRVRDLHSIDVPADGGPRCNNNGRSQSSMCLRIDGLLDIAMAFWGTECAQCATSEY